MITSLINRKISNQTNPASAFPSLAKRTIISLIFLVIGFITLGQFSFALSESPFSQKKDFTIIDNQYVVISTTDTTALIFESEIDEDNNTLPIFLNHGHTIIELMNKHQQHTYFDKISFIID